MGDCLAPGDWPVVRGIAVGLTRRQGIRRAVLGHVYGGAAVPVSCGGGVVRLRAARTGFQPRHRFRLLFGGGAGAAAQVRRHLSTSRALSLPCLTHAGPWMQRRALTLLFDCAAGRRLSSVRPRAGHATTPA